MKKATLTIFLVIFILTKLLSCSDGNYVFEDIQKGLPLFDIPAKRVLDYSYSEEAWYEDYQDVRDFLTQEESRDTDSLDDIFDIIWNDENQFDTNNVVCPSDLVLSSRYLGDLKAAQTVNSSINGDCDAVRFSLIMSAGQEFSFYIRGTNLMPSVILTGPGRIRSDRVYMNKTRGLPLIFSFVAERTGEYFLVLSQTDLRRASPFSITVSCVNNCEKVATRYPIVMVHGFSGFKNIGPVEYFYNVPSILNSMGYDVHIAKLDPYNSVEVRGTQLKEFIENVVFVTGANRVNIIAHSQGGLDSRFVISGLMLAEKIATLTTIGTPHYGTPLADLILSDPTGAGKAALDAMLIIMGAALDSQSRANAMASLYSLSVEYVKGTFNHRYPDDYRVVYYSYAGKTCRIWEGCGDTVDIEISLTYEILRELVGDNDGIVPTESSKWGRFLEVLPADHFDEVGQIAGVTNPNFNHIEFYKGIVQNLREEGF